ncbi:HAD family hydrolase [Streptomyces sp. f51]|uniref:HAD family hydrolase n=1 Tax=Streptomyces sp. f51 TaxID=1827742 RepID=UPI0030D28053
MIQDDRTGYGKLNDRGAMRRLARYLTPDPCVIFDFDGPLCRLFPDGSSAPLAEDLRRIVVARGAEQLLVGEARASIDPQVVLKTVYRQRPRSLLAAELEARLAEGETAAAAIAPPTPGADLLVRELSRLGVRVAVATNNAPAAVTAYLRRVEIEGCFEGHIHGRTDDPTLLKPDPDSVERALRGLGAAAHDAVMIGDMPTDGEAAREAKVAFVGYARDEAGAGPLWAAGAELVLSHIELLSTVIRPPLS